MVKLLIGILVKLGILRWLRETVRRQTKRETLLKEALSSETAYRYPRPKPATLSVKTSV